MIRTFSIYTTYYTYIHKLYTVGIRKERECVSRMEYFNRVHTQSLVKGGQSNAVHSIVPQYCKGYLPTTLHIPHIIAELA